MNNYKLTITGLLISGSVYLTALYLEINFFDQLLVLLLQIEKIGFADLLIPLFVFSLFVVIDMRRRTKTIKLENAKLKIYRAMLSSSHHILNNFLYQMDIFKITAEDTPGFDAKVLSFYEDIKNNTSDQIHSLSNVPNIDEHSIRTCVMSA